MSHRDRKASPQGHGGSKDKAGTAAVGHGTAGTAYGHGLHSGMRRKEPNDGDYDPSMRLPSKATVNANTTRSRTASTPKTLGPRVA